jgi:type II secretory pathway predicted ATPase ExeA
MAFSNEQRKELLKPTAALRHQIIRQAREYMARTGLNETDFAYRLRSKGGSSYSRTTVNLFLNDRYHIISSDDSAICDAIRDFMEKNPIALLQENNGKLYETQNVKLVRKCFYEALDGRRACYFRGAPGSQKTFVLQHLIAELNRSEISKNGHGRRAFYVRARNGITPNQMMKRVAEAAGGLMAGDIDHILRNLRFDLGRRKVLFVIDEAQALDIPCLETLRELHDMPPHCGLLFAGSHELEKTFNRLDMEQWHSRLRQGAELPGVSEEEAEFIIRAELGEQPKEKIQGLIKKCYATDMRKGREVKYISARTLFWSIQTIQERQQQAKGAKA